MSRNRKNRQPKDNHPAPESGAQEIHIPLGMVSIGSLAELIAPSPSHEQLAAKWAKDGVWHRIVDGGASCPEGHRDRLLMGVTTVDRMRASPEMRRTIGLDCLDGCHGGRARLVFDREAARHLVNALSEAIAESERRERAAAGTMS